jgi:hypothetical protein
VASASVVDAVRVVRKPIARRDAPPSAQSASTAADLGARHAARRHGASHDRREVALDLREAGGVRVDEVAGRRHALTPFRRAFRCDAEPA